MPSAIWASLPRGGLLLLSAALAGTAAAYNLSDYKYYCGGRVLEGTGTEASGITFSAATGTLWVVSRNPLPTLHEFTPWPAQPQLLPLRVLALKGVTDPEAVAVLGGTQLAVTDEETSRVYAIDTASGGGKLLFQAGPGVNVVENSGFEGLAVEPGGRYLLLAQEQKPRRILRADLQTGAWQEVLSLEPNASVDEANGRGRKKQPKQLWNELKDVSDMHLAPSSLFLLSQESRRVAQLSWPGGVLLDTKRVEGERPEGLTFLPDGRFMLVASEGDQNKGFLSTLHAYSIQPC